MLKLRDAQGNLAVALDRGDGLLIKLTAPAKAFEAVTLAPILAEKRLTVQLIGVPNPMDEKACEIDLAVQTLEVETRPPAE